MKKLYRLREWLTLPDAAAYLAAIFEEDVSEADLLRLALDGHLTLSVDFVNHAPARIGPLVPLSKAKTKEFPMSREAAAEFLGRNPDELPPETRGVAFLKGLDLPGDMVAEIGEKVTYIEGIWELTMAGNEAIDIEHLYQSQTGGPAVELKKLNGVIVRRGDEFAQIQEHMERDRPLDIKNLRSRRDFDEGYYPAGGLPADAVLVVRIAALEDLKARLRDVESAEGPADDGLPSRPPPGRPKAASWPVWISEMVAFVYEDGIPPGIGTEGVDGFIASIAERLAVAGLEGPSRTTVQETARAVLKRLRDAGNLTPGISGAIRQTTQPRTPMTARNR